MRIESRSSGSRSPMRIRLSRKIASGSNASCYGWRSLKPAYRHRSRLARCLAAVSGLLRAGKVYNGPRPRRRRIQFALNQGSLRWLYQSVAISSASWPIWSEDWLKCESDVAERERFHPTDHLKFLAEVAFWRTVPPGLDSPAQWSSVLIGNWREQTTAAARAVLLDEQDRVKNERRRRT